jgi:hypothetical protein
MRRLRGSVLRRYGYMDTNDFVFAVDDTDNPKYGASIHGMGSWHGSKGAYRGQKILVVALVDIRRGVAIPLSYAFATKKGNPDYCSLIDKTADLLGDCIAEGFPRLPVVTDSWFDAADLMSALQKIGLTFNCELKSNRWICGTAAPRGRKTRLPEFFADEPRQGVMASPNVTPSKRVGKAGRPRRKSIAERIGKINGFKSPVKIVAVYDSSSSSHAFAHYMSTDRQMSGARIWSISRARWAIEVLFRNLKQNLSFGRMPCAGKGAADLAVCLPFALYISLVDEAEEVWGIEARKSASVGMRVQQVRERALDSAVNLIAANPQHPVVKSLRARRSTSGLRRKPRTTAAGRFCSPQSLSQRA